MCVCRPASGRSRLCRRNKQFIVSFLYKSLFFRLSCYSLIPPVQCGHAFFGQTHSSIIQRLPHVVKDSDVILKRLFFLGMGGNVQLTFETWWWWWMALYLLVGSVCSFHISSTGETIKTNPRCLQKMRSNWKMQSLRGNASLV